ncbi:uncharacterized protein LOC110902021 [Helianthus annuus]|uniref:uncharacterized protein LOC110902021 n=1 Tax=Helianthus annuus TaxID=4232 RepID=UPI000B903B1C|nr:uncharacterized protein LOC110902021 [Helianthus annuus]
MAELMAGDEAESSPNSSVVEIIDEITNFLFAKNKIGFVDGTINKPEKTDKKYMNWMRCDAMIKGWLTTAMEKEIRASVKYANTAAEIWKDLHEIFGKESAPRTYEIKQSITMTRQEEATVSAYFTKLRGLWDEIDTMLQVPRCECKGCTCDIGKKLVELKEKERLYEFLMGLNSDFAVIRTQILAMKPTPTLGVAYHLVAEDEQQRNITVGKKVATETMAFQVAQQGKRDVQPQKKSWQKTEKTQQNTKTGHCTFCGRNGHIREGCFKLIGYPDWFFGKEKKEYSKPKAVVAETTSSPVPGLSDEQYNMFLNFFGKKEEQKEKKTSPPAANMAGSFDKNGNWIMDSVATDSMTHVRGLLDNLTMSTSELSVTIPNGQTIPVKGNGEGLRTRSLIGSGMCSGGLYRMEAIRGNPKAITVEATNVWHKRLGHPSSFKLSHISFLKDVGFDSENNFCDYCV